jgi:titin
VIVAAALLAAQLTWSELLRVSDVVVTGAVESVGSAPDRNDTREFVSLAVDEVLKGWIPERHIVLVQPDTRVPFRPGEQVLLFLEVRGDDRTLATTAQSQGRWTIASDARTGERIARRDAADMATVVPFGRLVPAVSLAALRDAARPSFAAAVQASRVPIDVRPRMRPTAAAASLTETEMVPGVPQALSVRVTNVADGAIVDLAWLPPATGGAPASYRVEAGSLQGASDIAVVPVATTSLHATVALGFSAFVRVRAVNGAGVSAASNEVRVSAAIAVPDAPGTFDGNLAHGFLELMWVAPGSGRPATYLVEAGSSSGATDRGRFETSSADTVASAFVAPGPWFLRVRARNSAGVGPPSNEIAFRAPGSLNCLAPPNAPTDVTASVAGSTLALSFTPTDLLSTYVLQGGSAPGASDAGTLDVGQIVPAIVGGVPAGTYYLRLFARNPQCGLGPASSELVVTVP